MIEETPSRDKLQGFYDRLGARYDWFEFYEGHAKALALKRLLLDQGQRVLSIGVGTGKEHTQIQAAIQPAGLAIGIDISTVMLSLAKERSQTPMCQADARQLPFAGNYFDRLYAAYVLDLLPLADVTGLLAGFQRVLKPGGIMVLLALTEGVNPSSRLLVAVWKAAYAASPVACGGCRPLQLTNFVEASGFIWIKREVVVQLAVPSELISARKSDQEVT
jgi:ubiquinone/menaquinone biosynthesis C-methylase UbiE